MLKYAGWDGVVIEGQAEKPVWVDIRNGTVQIRDCKIWLCGEPIPGLARKGFGTLWPEKVDSAIGKGEW